MLSLTAIVQLLSALGAGAIITQLVNGLMSRRIRSAQAHHEEVNVARDMGEVFGKLVDRLDARVLDAENRAEFWRDRAVRLEIENAELRAPIRTEKQT